jgi:hypothetical protein
MGLSSVSLFFLFIFRLSPQAEEKENDKEERERAWNFGFRNRRAERLFLAFGSLKFGIFSAVRR